MNIDEMVAFLRDANCHTTCVYQKECHGDRICDEGIKKWLLKEE